jgi:hypothetical protein
MPVNDKGDWHVSHAFGDVCEFCHAGNVQAVEADAAHTGMVDPLADVQASCAACHPDDTVEMAEVYAVALGVEVGMGSSGASSGGEPSQGGSATGEESPGTIVDLSQPEIVTEDLIDFNRRYEETVLGVREVNWGNVILGVMIAVVAVGSGDLHSSQAEVQYVHCKTFHVTAMPVMPLRGHEDMDVQVDRRGFLGLLTRALLWFSGATGVVGMVRFLSYDQEPASKGLYTLELPAAYPLGSMTPIPEARVFLVRDQTGFYARSLICPHLGCVLEKSEGAISAHVMEVVLGNWVSC